MKSIQASGSSSAQRIETNRATEPAQAREDVPSLSDEEDESLFASRSDVPISPIVQHTKEAEKPKVADCLRMASASRSNTSNSGSMSIFKNVSGAPGGTSTIKRNSNVSVQMI